MLHKLQFDQYFLEQELMSFVLISQEIYTRINEGVLRSSSSRDLKFFCVVDMKGGISGNNNDNFRMNNFVSIYLRRQRRRR